MKRFYTNAARLYGSARRIMLYGVLALLTVACTIAPVQPPASAQDKLTEIDQLFRWATAETPGCTVGVAQNGEVVVNRAYGMADLERAIPMSTSTRFDIGSVQKQFVAAAILLLVEDGKLGLADDIRLYFPELPDYGQVITVDHLLTHTSGIRDWTGLLPLARESEDALTMILRQRGLNFVPGEEWAYSNSGYVLLKELIARTTGSSFSEFAQARLFVPLGMASSIYAQDVREIEDRALAYDQAENGWRLNILVGDARGDGGGLLTTASDLLIWNEALTNARLGAFVSAKLQEPAKLNNGREVSYARGLFLDEDAASSIVWHSGSAAAYKSMLARLPEQGLSFAILCNAGDSTEEQQFANKIINLFITETPEANGVAENAAGEAVATSSAPAPDPSARAGLFFNARGEPLRLVVQNGRLYADDGPELIPTDEDRYRTTQSSLGFMSDDTVEVHFASADEFILTTSVGETIPYRRAQPVALTATDLEAFVGRYESDELRATFDIAQTDEGLTVQLNGSQPFALTPVDRDTFQISRMFLRFLRDERGEVIAIDYSNPVLRNVRFSR